MLSEKEKKAIEDFEFIIRRYNSSNNKITKHSKNIVDLIEVGDILELQEDDVIFYIGIKKDMTTLSYSDIKEKIKSGEVKLLSILTKEQIEAHCYKVGE